MKLPAAALAALLILGGCDKPAQTGGAPGDKFAGLDAAELNWRKDIIATDPLCKSTVEDQKCSGFEVACKAERTISPVEQAHGVTAKLVVMMTWNGFDPKFRQTQSATRAELFAKTNQGWVRSPHGAVYMQTCGDM